MISATGQMTIMRKIAPESFVELTLWIAEHTKFGEAAKRRRDLHQAEIVQKLISDGLSLSGVPTSKRGLMKKLLTDAWRVKIEGATTYDN
ncbi:hypothetical protein ACVBEF_03605 [Glaciimonas sp. GG7]